MYQKGKLEEILKRVESKRLSISLDVDDTLAELTLASFEELYKRGIEIPIEEYSRKYLEGKDPLLDGIYKYVWHNFKVRPSITQNELKRLMEKYYVDIVTAKPASEIPYLYEWMRTYFPEIAIRIIRVELPEEKTKLGYDIYIDDMPRVYSPVNSSLFIIIKRPWNINLDGNNIIKVGSLKEAIDLLTKI